MSSQQVAWSSLPGLYSIDLEGQWWLTPFPVCITKSTSYPGSSLFLPRESTLVSAGHVAPKIWVLTRMCYRGGVAKCKIVTSVRMVESTGGDVSFFRNICGDKNSFYRLEYFFVTYERSTSKRSMLFSTQKNTFTSLWISIFLNFAIVNRSRHQSQHNKFTTRRVISFMLYGAWNEMECQGLGRTNLFLAFPRSSRIFSNRTQDRQTAQW